MAHMLHLRPQPLSNWPCSYQNLPRDTRAAAAVKGSEFVRESTNLVEGANRVVPVHLADVVLVELLACSPKKNQTALLLKRNVRTIFTAHLHCTGQLRFIDHVLVSRHGATSQASVLLCSSIPHSIVKTAYCTNVQGEWTARARVSRMMRYLLRHNHPTTGAPCPLCRGYQPLR